MKKKSATVQVNDNQLVSNSKINKEEINITIKPRTYQNKKINNQLIGKIEINEFLSEFEGYNSLDSFEERKYCIPSPININEINLFFTKIKDNQKFFKFD